MPYTSKSEARTERSIGSVYDVNTGTMQPLDRVDHVFFLKTQERTSSGPYHGDHHTAYDYGMGAGRVISDSPFVIHQYYDNPVDHLTSNYDYYSSEYLSKYRTPFSSSTINGPKMENAISEAITSALGSLRGKHSNWGSDLGEMRQNVDSFSKAITKGSQFLYYMKRGRFNLAAEALGISRRSFSSSNNRGRALANAWLAYSYGWRPYAQSVHDMQQTIADIVDRNSNNVEATGTGHASGGSSGTYYGKIRQSSNWHGSARCVLKATIDSPTAHNITKMGLSNPASIAWELTPFSFVVDWFVPVGNVLDALTAAQGLTFHGGWFSVRQRETLSLKRETGVETPWATCVNGGSYSEEQFTFNRTALAGFPLPRLYADLTPYSTPRAVNALALVRKLT